jgi:Glycosyl transferase family 2
MGDMTSPAGPNTESASVTAILTSWKRPWYLPMQIASLRAQTTPPAEIWVWADTCDENRHFAHASLPVDRVFRNAGNSGVYGRFAAGLLARTRYVVIFDDDTIPGRRYLENCLDTMRASNGIIAECGVVFTSATYRGCERYGWDRRTTEVRRVDVGCHSWFLERQWIAYLWLEPPFDWGNGEDMRLSYLSQKYGGIVTYTPAQPTDDLCGSLFPHLGIDTVALSAGEEHYRLRTAQLVEQLGRGWQTVRGVRL